MKQMQHFAQHHGISALVESGNKVTLHYRDRSITTTCHNTDSLPAILEEIAVSGASVEWTDESPMDLQTWIDVVGFNTDIPETEYSAAYGRCIEHNAALLYLFGGRNIMLTAFYNRLMELVDYDYQTGYDALENSELDYWYWLDSEPTLMAYAEPPFSERDGVRFFTFRNVLWADPMPYNSYDVAFPVRKIGDVDAVPVNSDDLALAVMEHNWQVEHDRQYALETQKPYENLTPEEIKRHKLIRMVTDSGLIKVLETKQGQTRYVRLFVIADHDIVEVTHLFAEVTHLPYSSKKEQIMISGTGYAAIDTIKERMLIFILDPRLVSVTVL